MAMVVIHKKMVEPLTTEFLRQAFAETDTVTCDTSDFDTPAKRKSILDGGGIRYGNVNFGHAWTRKTMRYLVEGTQYLSLIA